MPCSVAKNTKSPGCKVEAEQVLPIGQISKWRLPRDLLSIPDSRMSKTPGSLRLGLWEVHFLGLRALEI